MSIVGLTKIQNTIQNQNPLKQALNETLSLIDYKFENSPKKIVIKPNLCYYWDSTTGQTSDPRFVGELIDFLREKISKDVQISVVESDASAMRCKYAFRMLGFERLALEKNVQLINLSEEPSDETEVFCNGKPYKFQVPKIIKEADLRINLPKIKYTVDPIKITCALKNLYGCNPYTKKYKLHNDLGNVIVALNKAMPFDLVIIDSNIASGIQPRRIGLMMASTDPVAIDVAAAQIAWLNSESIPYLRLAEKERVGNRWFIERGAKLEQFKALYPKKTVRRKVMGRAYKMVLQVGLGRRLGLT
ncbi:MAG: DUF362 domain-containing protein [Candidatus Bathyarchaeia archaeon]|jgi:uncharacterized protein (DUF362 family)